MPMFTGTVTCVEIAESFGFTTVRDSGGDTETFILYFGSSIPATLTAFTRIQHSMWLSLLRESITNRLPVTISHPDNSAEVLFVRLGS
jgi:hypothetical protein